MFLINLNTFEKIKKFMSISDRLDYDFNLISGQYVVNGKSIMGLFGLDLSKPVEVKVLSQKDYYPKEIEEFLVSVK